MSPNHAHRCHPVRLRAVSTSIAERAAATIAARELRTFQIQSASAIANSGPPIDTTPKSTCITDSERIHSVIANTPTR